MITPAQVTDHIQELLVLVVRFTRARRRVLINNLRRMDREGFVPQDLAVEEFTQQLHLAINEHVLRGRLVLRDNPHVRFGARGRLELVPETDCAARDLLRGDPEAYLRDQTQRLFETSLNERLALQMLRRHIHQLNSDRKSVV
jgi:hypothetical protein